MSVGLIDPQASAQNNNFGLGNIPTAQDYEDLRAAQQSFAQMAGYLSGSTINVTYKNNPQRYTGAYITEDLFKIIGVSPIMGRDFTADDNKPGAEKVAILSHEIWKRDFNGDPNIVGQSVRINGKAATIIGVMPPNFKFPFSEQLWVSLYNEFPPVPRGQLVIGANNAAPAVMGRLKPGVSIDQVNAEFRRPGASPGAGQSENQQHSHVCQRPAPVEGNDGPATTSAGLGNACRGHPRFADRVRERDEYAIWSRRPAGKGNGDSLVRSAPPVGESCAKC
jgi:hypothetical protein